MLRPVTGQLKPLEARERDDFLSQIPLLSAETHEVVLRPVTAIATCHRHCELERNARALLGRDSQVLIDQIAPGWLMDLSQQDPIDRLTQRSPFSDCKRIELGI